MTTQEAINYIDEITAAGITPAELMGAGYDRQAGRNKKRVLIYDGNGAKIATFYDYGGAGYLYKEYARIFNAPRYVVKVYEIGSKTPCAIA